MLCCKKKNVGFPRLHGVALSACTAPPLLDLPQASARAQTLQNAVRSAISAATLTSVVRRLAAFPQLCARRDRPWTSLHLTNGCARMRLPRIPRMRLPRIPPRMYRLGAVCVAVLIFVHSRRTRLSAHESVRHLSMRLQAIPPRPPSPSPPACPSLCPRHRPPS